MPLLWVSDMNREQIEKINLIILLSINLLTFLRNAYGLRQLFVSQRNFKDETRRRLDDLEKSED